MNTLKTLQQYAKGHWATDKTRNTTCTFKRGAVQVTENRLWVWLMGSENPILVKEDWLTGDDRADFASLFNQAMKV